MNIITADFNWLSFLIMVVGITIGIVKSNKKSIEQSKPRQAPVFPFEEDDDENYALTNQITEEEKSEEILESLNDRQWSPIMETTTEESLTDSLKNTQDEQDEEVKKVFDIRQAIISSEILNRPNF